MILADVNVLIYAFRQDVPQYAICRPWLNRVILSDARFAVSRLALSTVVRISTDRRIYSTPSTLDQAFGFCEDLLGQPNSHGCIRIEKPLELANLILPTPVDSTFIQSCLKDEKPMELDLTNTVPVFVIYSTAGINADNNAVYYKDVYKLLKR